MRYNEVCLLLDDAGVVLWHEESTSPVALPDARARWDAIWRHRERLAEIVHTHPGGLLAFSGTDTTTMEAIDAALGRPLRYAVVTASAVLRREPDGTIGVLRDEPPWVAQLRTTEGAPWPS